MNARYWLILISTALLPILALTGCNNTSATVTALSTQPTPVKPTTTPMPSPTAAASAALPLTPTLTLPALAGKPVPLPQEPITPDNVDQIQELAIWGKGRIEQLAYSPDGKILVVGTWAGVWLYDADTLEELHFLNVGNVIDGLAFTEDGTKLIVDSGASTVSVWEVATASRLSSQRIREGYQGDSNSSPGSVTFSPGANILAAILDNRRIGLWADQGETYLYTLTQEKYSDMSDLVLSPDHKLLALRGGDKLVQLWDVTTETLLYSWEDNRYITPLAFSPQLAENGSEKSFLAVSGVGEPIKLWDTQTGVLVKTLGEPKPATALAFSPDGALLASTFFDTESNNILQIWRVADGNLLYTLQTGDTDTVNNLIFSPDGKILTSGSWGGKIQRWNIDTGTLVDSLEDFGHNGVVINQGSPPLPAFWSKDEVFLTNPINHQIELWDLKTGQIIKTLTGHKSQITNLALSGDNSKLVSAELWTDTIQIWNPATGQNLGTPRFYTYTGEDKALSISADGRLIATGESLRGRNPGAVYNISQLDNWLYFLPGNGSLDPAFSLDREKIASFSGQITITISKAETGESLHTLDTGSVGGGLAFSPDSQVLATGGQTGTIQLWDANTGALLNTLSGETNNRVVNLAYSPDGQILAAGMKDPQMPAGALTPTVWLWDVKTGILLRAIEDYQANIIYLTFSPDGALLATASLDGTMRLWGIPPK